jgi:holo-[acyl-carrier protein] synthase
VPAKPRQFAARSRESSLIVGTDIVEVGAVAQSMQTFGDRYLNFAFTRNELRYCLAPGRSPAPHLAARFAAKEATMKVLRPAKDQVIGWRQIEMVRTEDGWCEVLLSGWARALANDRGIRGLSVSMSHEAHYATAVVIGERKKRPVRLPRRTAKATISRGAKRK